MPSSRMNSPRGSLHFSYGRGSPLRARFGCGSTASGRAAFAFLISTSALLKRSSAARNLACSTCASIRRAAVAAPACCLRCCKSAASACAWVISLGSGCVSNHDANHSSSSSVGAAAVEASAEASPAPWSFASTRCSAASQAAGPAGPRAAATFCLATSAASSFVSMTAVQGTRMRLTPSRPGAVRSDK